MVETRTDQAARNKVWDMIRDVQVAMMATVDAEGHMRARPMRAVGTEDFTGTLWFFTSGTSPKAEEIRHDNRVLLTYSDPRSQTYVAITGTARVVRDPAKQQELWSEPLRTWFPGGPHDVNAALLCVEAEGAEYWDAPSSTFVHAYGYLRSRLTGEAPANLGDNDKVAFRRPA